MKKLLTTILILLGLLGPLSVLASAAIPWNITNLTDVFISPTAVNGVKKGIIVAASSTIGNGNQNGGLTISGGATTTGSAYIAGNLGIGTQAPGSAIEINNSGAASTLKVIGNSSTIASGFNITDSLTANNLFTSVVNPSGTGNSNLATVPLSATFQTGAGTTGGIYFVAKAANSPIVFGAGASAFSGERMRISGITGFVGIGTTSPYALLSLGGNLVVGASTAGGTLGDLFLPKLGTAVGAFLAVDATGKVIATTTPSTASSTLLADFNTFSGTNTFATATVGSINGVISVDGVHYAQTGAGINSAIQTCLNNQSTCGEVYMPAGVYSLNTAVLYDGDAAHSGIHLKLKGAGQDATILKLANNVSATSSPNTNYVVKARACTSCFFPAIDGGSSTVEMSDFTADYNGQNQTFNGVPTGILTENIIGSTFIHDVKVINVFVPSFGRAKIAYGIGIDTLGTHNLTIQHSTFSNNDEGVWLTDYYAGSNTEVPISTNVLGNNISSSTDADIYYEFGGNTQIIGNTLASSTFAIFGQTLPNSGPINGDVNSTIASNIIGTTTSYGIYMNGNKIHIDDNHLTHIGKYGIVAGGSDNEIIHNNLADIGYDGTDSFQDAIRIADGNNNSVVNNTVRKSGRDGISLSNASSSQITGNQLYDIGQSANNTFAGITLPAGNNGNTVSGNTIIASSSVKMAYGINNGGTNNMLTFNQVLGAVTAQYNGGQYFVQNQGNFGIGTSTPWGLLSIAALNSNAPQLVVGSTTVTSLFISGAGLIGFNGSHVNTTGRPVTLNAASSGDLLQFSTSGGNDQWHMTFQNSNADLGFSETAVADNRLLLKAGGNVGFATSSPGTLLSIGNTGVNTINISPTATSTFGSGVNIRTGCFAINSVCLSAGGSGTVTSIATNNGLTGGTITTSGTIGLATINAGVLSAVTNGSIPTSQATSTLYGTGIGGQVLTWSNGVPSWVGTTTFNTPLSFANGAVSLSTAGTWSGNAGTATALAANGTNCSAGNAPLGVDASGNAEGCFGVQAAGTYLTALGSGFGTTTGTTITHSTSTLSFNGLTFGQTIIPSAGALLFTPTVTGTLNNTGLTNSSLTVTAGTGMSGGGAVSLGSSVTLNNAIGYPFLSNATTTGLGIYASTTIGNGTQAGGLTVSGGATTTGTLLVNGTYNDTVPSSLMINQNGNSNWISLTTASANVWRIANSNSGINFSEAGVLDNRLFIHQGGGVGINTSNVASLFSDSGNASIGSTYIGTAAPTNGLIVQGNVGIGTTSPFATLAVNPSAGNASNEFVVGSSTATAFLINNSGNVVIGGTHTAGIAGGAPLTLNANSSNNTMVLANSSASDIWNIALVSNSINFSEIGVADNRLFIKTGGGVGVNTGAPKSLFDVAGSVSIGSYGGNNAAPSNGLIVSGTTGIGTSSPWRTLAVTGTVGFDGLTGSSGLQVGILCLSANKEVINESVACVASAARYKQQIQPLTVGLNEVMKLNPVSFYWKPDYNGTLQNDPNFNGQQISLIADQVQKIDPRLVTVTTATTTFEGKTYTPGTINGLASVNAWAGLFVKAIQDIEGQIMGVLSRLTGDEVKLQSQQVQINQLQIEITALQAKLK